MLLGLYVRSMMMSTHGQLQPVKFDHKALQTGICPLPILPIIHQSATSRHCTEMTPVQSTSDRDLCSSLRPTGTPTANSKKRVLEISQNPISMDKKVGLRYVSCLSQRIRRKLTMMLLQCA